MPDTAAIEAVDLVKTYGRGTRSVRALSGVTFQVQAGTVFGVLGPNGAGKSTAIRVLTTLSAQDSGTATVAGLEVGRHPDRVRRLIGCVAQRPGFDPVATGRENLVLSGRLHGMPARACRRRAEELLARFDLLDAGNRLARTWSGGMQRKLDVAIGLMHRPQVLFLDEPTTGLDPQARHELWAEISRLAREDGTTVLLTTHYLDEADRLAAELVIVDRGRVVASGTPDRLKAGLGADTVRLGWPQDRVPEQARRALAGLPEVTDVLLDTGRLTARVADGVAALPGILAALDRAGSRPGSVTVSRPSLDDVYLHHAGHRFRQAEPTAAGRDDAGIDSSALDGSGLDGSGLEGVGA